MSRTPEPVPALKEEEPLPILPWDVVDSREDVSGKAIPVPPPIEAVEETAEPPPDEEIAPIEAQEPEAT